MDNRYGSARFATPFEAEQACFFLPSEEALQLGFLDDKPIYSKKVAQIVSIAGSGGGKLRDIISYNLLSNAQPTLYLDPKGEITEISLYHQHRLNVKQYVFNPYRVRGLPHHDISPLEFLSLKSNSLNSDLEICARNFVTSKERENESFAQTGQRWFSGFAKADLEWNDDTASLSRIHTYIKMIDGNLECLQDLSDLMQRSRFSDVRQVGREVLSKQKAPKELSAIMACLHNAFGYLNEEAVCNAVENSECSLKELIKRERVSPSVKIGIIVPAEYFEIMAPLMRLMITVAMILKQRAPEAPTVLYLIDEAGQLGYFKQLLDLYTYGRGGGNKVWSFWQSIAQIERNFGKEAVAIILGSAQIRQFFSILDFDSAKYVSDMAGYQTLLADNHLSQALAELSRMNAVRTILEGQDPLFAAYEAQTYHQNSQYQERMRRLLREPDEVMRMTSREQIIFASSDDNCLHPIFAQRKPYFEQRPLAGKFMPNSSHPPTDKVLLPRLFGSKWARVLEADPPADKCDWPQFKNGHKVIEGFEP